MTLQEINLYRADFSRRRSTSRISKSSMLLTVAGLMLGGYIAGAGWDAWQQRQGLSNAVNEFTSTSHELSTIKNKLVGLVSQDGAPTLSALRSELAGLEERERLLRSVLGENGASGFSAYFVAFARQHIAGLWLTRIDIANHDGELIFAGRAVDPSLVPRYVTGLAGEAALQGMTLQSFRINELQLEDKSASNLVEFVVSTADMQALGM